MTRGLASWAVSVFAGVALTLSGCGDERPSTGSCDPACSGGLVCCSGACVSLNSSPNCGGCGITCGVGESCTSGGCVGFATDAGPMTDGGGGTDGAPGVDSGGMTSCATCDPMRSNGCGPSGCTCGASPQCAIGSGCASVSGAFICVNTQFDVNNCGELGNRCGDGERCNMGVCACGSAGRCAEGQGCCGGVCTDTSANNDHCGGCGLACPAGSSCGDSECRCGGATGPVCQRPMGSGMLGELCCEGACVSQNSSNCGGCGRACEGGFGGDCVWGAPLTGGEPGPCCGADLGGMAICTDFGGGGLPGF